MNPEPAPDGDRPNDQSHPRYVRRRGVLTAGAGMGTALLAGCLAGSGADPTAGDGQPADDPDDRSGNAGTFRLLISDQPVAIDEFDALNVSFDRARLFRGQGVEETEMSTPTPSATADGTATATDTASPTPSETASVTEAEVDDGESQGFVVIDLDGATVDLTQVVGEKAIGVFEGELEEGRYAKIELYAAEVEGIVGGEPVDVTIPSGKLQIVRPFEVVAGQTLSFVFDINVVKKGQSGEYNLLPVISESGVAGQDVEVTEVGNQPGDGSEPTGTEADDEQGDGPPDDPGGQP